MKHFKLNSYLLPFFIYLFIAHIIFFALPFSPRVNTTPPATPTPIAPIMVIEEKLIPTKKIETKTTAPQTKTVSKIVSNKPKQRAPIYKKNKRAPLSIPLPTPIETLHSKNSAHMPKLMLQSFQKGYENKLIFLMQQELKLPKYGEVKVAITLHCSGRVIDIKILDAQNDANKNYLLNSILKLNFPPFGKECQEDVQTFTVKFFNS